MPDRELPIYELEADLIRALRERGRVVVQAPTGSGKSTQIPQMLLAHGLLEKGEAVVLQPRRLAARMLAKRVAEEQGCALGDTVGYQIRLESRVSARTRVRFVTEGILLRQMSFDASLRGVSALVFDEFHERHLYGDISLARALQIQTATRPDLKIIVMSATLDTQGLTEYLAPCETLISQGRSHPVTIEYLPRTVNFESDPVWDAAARECARLAGRAEGDFLIFMPGAYEIGRTVAALARHRELNGCEVLPLHGELPPEAQDRAVARSHGRKIIVSTNVAETSLTIDGVTLVVDAGLARQARFDPNRGINTLLVEKISRASADQRAGRAGRTAPGLCLRLWTEREHAHRPAQELPEVRRLDLSEVVLTLKASGIDDIQAFPWLEKPEPRALERAETLLADLGALAAPEGGRRGPLVITETGRRMLRFPVHPRYARMLLEADARGCVRWVALMAALTQGRSFLLRGVPRAVEDARDTELGEETESDFFLLMRAWRFADQTRYDLETCRRLGLHAQGARAVRPLFESFLDIAKAEGLDAGDLPLDTLAVRKCVLAGFSDQVARRLDGGTLRCELVHGRRGFLARESSIQRAPLLVAAEISEIGRGDGEVSTLLSLATAIEESWLGELFPADYRNTLGVVYDPEMKRVITRRERRFRDLVLEAKASGEEPPLSEAAALLTREVVEGRLRIEAWDEAIEQWIVRVNRLAEWFPELEVARLGEADRALLIEQLCYGELGARAVRDKSKDEIMRVLREWLTAEQLAVLDDYLPERLVMANGRKARIEYFKDGPPVMAARIQELYGIEGAFSIGHGRVPVKIHVLAPNHRPIQVTDDLSLFWRDMYPKVKAELSRRYPRHEWR